ncbi:MAG: DegT/DnrJ/EryC1/StrS family aminotransferase [Hyphomicrobiaceae bacterium]
MAHKIEFVDLKAQRDRIRPELDAAMARVLDHGQFIMGPEVAELERQLAAYTGARHAITCASGTDALLIAMMAKGLGPGHAVLCPAFTYTATPETIALLGATPVFVEVDAATFNIQPEGLEAGLAAARARGVEPAAVIAVDLFGLPADYDAVRAFARKHGLWVLADAAQSFGGSWQGRFVGTLGDITATSFFPAKPLGCYGDGGAIFTDDDEVAEIMRSIRLHGKGVEKYDVVRVGLNGRLDTLQAAILIEKLKIFPEELIARRRVAARYDAGLGGDVTVPTHSNAAGHAWGQYTIRVAAGHRDPLIRALSQHGIPTQVYYPKPLHHQPAYARYPVATSGVPVAERLPAEVLSLPMHPYLASEQQQWIVDVVRAKLSVRPG